MQTMHRSSRFLHWLKTRMVCDDSSDCFSSARLGRHPSMHCASLFEQCVQSGIAKFHPRLSLRLLRSNQRLRVNIAARISRCRWPMRRIGYSHRARASSTRLLRARSRRFRLQSACVPTLRRCAMRTTCLSQVSASPRSRRMNSPFGNLILQAERVFLFRNTRPPGSWLRVH